MSIGQYQWNVLWVDYIKKSIVGVGMYKIKISLECELFS